MRVTSLIYKSRAIASINMSRFAPTDTLTTPRRRTFYPVLRVKACVFRIGSETDPCCGQWVEHGWGFHIYRAVWWLDSLKNITGGYWVKHGWGSSTYLRRYDRVGNR